MTDETTATGGEDTPETETPRNEEMIKEFLATSEGFVEALKAAAADARARQAEERRMKSAVPNLEGYGDVIEHIKELVSDASRDEVGVLELYDGTAVPLVRKHGGGYEIIDPSKFDPYCDAPVRIKDQHRAATLESFVDYVTRFKTENSALYGKISGKVAGASITAIIDHHGFSEGDDLAEPDWGYHTAEFPFPISVEWQAWTEKDNKWMSGREFGAFIEDRIPDLVSPPSPLPEGIRPLVQMLGSAIGSPQTIVEISKGLRVFQSATASEANNLNDGTGEIQFKVENSTANAKGGKLDVPPLFMIAVPVLKNGARYMLSARLRYRVEGGKLAFKYELWRPDVTFEAVYQDVCKAATIGQFDESTKELIAPGTDLPLYHTI